jgi:SAM-dependent methyltransferase
MTDQPSTQGKPDSAGDVQWVDESEDWYVRSFGELYPLLYEHRDDRSARREVAELITTAGLAGDERLVDVCCGAGRHLDAFGSAGFDAVGVDLSPQLLDLANQRPALRGRLVRADIRALPFAGEFDVAVNLFTSLGYFANDAENEQALQQIVQCVRPRGMVVIDHAYPPAVKRSLVPHTRQQVGGMIVEHQRLIRGNRVVKQTTIESDGHRQHLLESVRLFDPDEMQAMLRRAGVRAIRLVGGFDGSPLTPQASRMIALGVRT